MPKDKPSPSPMKPCSSSTGNKTEAIRLQSLADSRLRSSSFKSALKYARRAHRIDPSLPNLHVLITTAKVLRNYSQLKNTTIGNHYSVLLLPPFSPLQDLRKQFHSLSALLSDESNSNSTPIAAVALDAVEKSFGFLSDKACKRRYDSELRKQFQARRQMEKEKVRQVLSTFWTGCDGCRILHEFDRRYVGLRLVCPNCRRGFTAVEVEIDSKPSISEDRRMLDREVKYSVGETRDRPVAKRRLDMVDSPAKKKTKEKTLAEMQMELIKVSKVMNKDNRSITEKRVIGNEERVIVLALAACSNENMKEVHKSRGKGRKEKKIVNLSVKEKNEYTSSMLVEVFGKDSKKVDRKSREKARKEKEMATFSVEEKDMVTSLAPVEDSGKNRKSEARKSREKGRKDKEIAIVSVEEENEDRSLIAVEDSDFYNFDEDRVEKSFRKGQVWAIYDDNDGMPRNYGLIDEVMRTHPFRVKMSWLDFQSSGDEMLVLWEKLGHHISCGRFKVGQKVNVDSLNMFSHIVDCERAAKEIYRIFPRKGSVWALYGEQGSSADYGRQYDIVVLLTSYSELHGLSMAYLEKVQGYKTVFKRQEIGFHAVRWLEKDELKIFSHEIPARKLSDIEGVDLQKDCWELDPASLPSDLICAS